MWEGLTVLHRAGKEFIIFPFCKTSSSQNWKSASICAKQPQGCKRGFFSLASLWIILPILPEKRSKNVPTLIENSIFHNIKIHYFMWVFSVIDFFLNEGHIFSLSHPAWFTTWFDTIRRPSSKNSVISEDWTTCSKCTQTACELRTHFLEIACALDLIPLPASES